MAEQTLKDIGPVVLIGAGKMGLAMARGWIAGGLPPDRLVLVDPHRRARPRQAFAAEHGVRLLQFADGVLTHVLVLAVKPQNMPTVLQQVLPVVGKHTLVLSIAAGISLDTLADGLGTERVVRTMPNTPAQLGKGITGAVGLEISEADQEVANLLLRAAGEVVWFDAESHDRCGDGGLRVRAGLCVLSGRGAGRRGDAAGVRSGAGDAACAADGDRRRGAARGGRHAGLDRCART